MAGKRRRKRDMMRGVVATFLIVAASAAHAGPRSELAPEVKKWIATIQAQRIFDTDGHGDGAADAVRALLQHPQGDTAFKQLLAKGPIVAQLYVLCGLYFTDMKAFQAGVRRLSKSKVSVRTESDDLWMDRPVGEIVKHPGNEGFIAPGEAPADWRRRNPHVH